MRMIRPFSALLLTLVALATSISLAWSDSPEPIVRIEPASIQASAGDTVQFTIEIHDVANLGAFQFDLTYDPTIVQVDNITLGDFPGSTGRSVNPLGPKIQAGKAVYGAFSFGDAAGPDGSGTLATVTLKALAGGQTPLGLGNVQVIDIGGARIQASTQGAAVAVSGSPAAPQSTAVTRSPRPTLASTATVETLLATPQESANTQVESASPLKDWVITAAALVAILSLAILAARRMAR